VTIFVLLMTVFMSIPGLAVDWDGVLDIPSLKETLPQEAEELLEDSNPLELPDASLGDRLRDKLLREWNSLLPEILQTGACLVLVSVLVSLGCSFCTEATGEKLVTLAGVTTVGSLVLDDFQKFLHTGLSSLESLSDFSRALLPTLTAASAAGGAVSSSAAKYAATVFAMDCMLTAAQDLISPLICALAALTVANAALEHPTLSAVGKLIKTACTVLLILLAFSFTLWLSLSGILNGTVDALTARATKTAVSAALPVVGSVISDAAGSLAAAAGTVRNTVGIFGMLAVLAVCIGPFLQLLLRYLVFKLAGAAAECVTGKRLSGLLSNLGDCFGLILGLNGCGALMLFVSVYSMMRAST